MKANILFKEKSTLTIENIFAISNQSSKIENDQIVVKVHCKGNEWQSTKIKCHDILCIEVYE